MVEYSPEANEPAEMETIDIIAMDYDRVYLQKVSCETVYDTLTLMEGRAFSGSALRIRGLKFVELTREHEDALSLLIFRCLKSASSG